MRAKVFSALAKMSMRIDALGVTSNESSLGYALFDLDQTIVPWDTQLLFCNFVLKKRPLRRLYLLGFIPFAPFAKWLGPGRMKRVFLNYLAGLTPETIDAYAREMVDHLVPDGLYAEIVEEVEKHKAAGRMTILNSASPDIWVKYLAVKLGFDHYYGTQVEMEGRVKLFPKLIGPNNKGDAKILRMQKHFPQGWKPGDKLPDSYGYSDSHADLPMLEICEHVVMVHPTEKLADMGGKHAWRTVLPVRPTKDKRAFGIACARQALGLYPL